MILLLAEVMKGHNILHVLNGSVHSIDKARAMIERVGGTPATFATIYALAGCDFLPGTYGVSHDIYLRAYCVQAGKVDPLNATSDLTEYEVLVCLAYLCKHGMIHVMNDEQKVCHRNKLLQMMRNGALTRKDMARKVKEVFCSTHDMGSELWIRDVRNLVADSAVSLCHLIPARPHIALQAMRARFVVYKYWSKSDVPSVKPSEVGGCKPSHGYSESGEVLVENEEDVKRLQKQIKDVILSCSCKGKCDSSRCSCCKGGLKCVGCKCAEEICQNRMLCYATNTTSGNDDNISKDLNYVEENENTRSNVEQYTGSQHSSYDGSLYEEDGASQDYDANNDETRNLQDTEVDVDELIECIV